MNIDTRINNDFFQHPKTIKLQEELGEFAPMFLIKLWLYVSKFFPDGIIKNMSNKMLEKQIGWKGCDDKNFIETLEKIGFIEIKNNEIIIHDWDDHNQYASTNNTRKDLNRFNTLKRYFPEVANLLKNKGIKAISIEQYKAIKSSKNPIKEAIRIFKLPIDENNANLNMQWQLQSQCNGNCNRNANDKCPNPIPNTNTNTKNQSNSPPISPSIEMGGNHNKNPNNENFEDEPSSDFVELREFYDSHARLEWPLAGWAEFKKLKTQTRAGKFPGIFVIMDDIAKRVEGHFWSNGHFPSLAKYLNERIWEQKITSREREQPKTFTELEEEREKTRRKRLEEKLREIQNRPTEKE